MQLLIQPARGKHWLRLGNPGHLCSKIQFIILFQHFRKALQEKFQVLIGFPQGLLYFIQMGIHIVYECTDGFSSITTGKETCSPLMPGIEQKY